MQTKSGVHYIQVTADQACQRIDNFLRTRYKDLPKSRLYRLIRKGEIRANKKRITPDYRLLADDVIRMPPLIMTAPLSSSQGIELPKQFETLLTKRILYEDKFLIIFNKPSGLAVHGGSGVRWGAIEAFRRMRPGEKYLELVHRLDRETSGCLILAKKPTVLRECHQLLREGKIIKRYLTLVKGRWPAYVKFVQEALQKSCLQGGERMVHVDQGGKPSKTLFTIKQHYAQTTLLEARPETGRTHQIRVHAAHAGFPIVGDDKYGDAKFNALMRAYGCERLFLHAERLQFNLQELLTVKIDVSAPLDDDLLKCLKRLKAT